MRILYLSKERTPHDRRFLEALIDGGFEVGYVTLGSAQRDSKPLPRGVSVLKMDTPVSVQRPRDVVDAMPAWLNVVSDFEPEVIHAGPVPTSGLMATWTGLPFVAMSWGSDLLVDVHSETATKWAARHVLLNADLFLCDCDPVRNAGQELASVPGEKIIQFPWGVDLDRFRPDGQETEVRKRLGWEDKKVIVSTRYWDERHAVGQVVEAFRRAHAEVEDFRLVLAGDGPLRDRIRGQIDRNDLEAVVHTPGLLKEGSIADHLRSADVYLSCTPSDGSSVSLLEALATGLPVVVADAPGNRQWVEPGTHGWLAAPGDVETFADNLVAAATLESEECDRIRTENRKLAEARADWNENASMLIDAYRGVEAGS